MYQRFGWNFKLFWDGFGLIFGWFLAPWNLQNERPVQARCYFLEILFFLTIVVFGLIFG